MPTIKCLGLVTQSTDAAIVLLSMPRSIEEQTPHAAPSLHEGVRHTTYGEAAERFKAEIASLAQYAANMKPATGHGKIETGVTPI